jgi:hypothetical protein
MCLIEKLSLESKLNGSNYYSAICVRPTLKAQYYRLQSGNFSAVGWSGGVDNSRTADLNTDCLCYRVVSLGLRLHDTTQFVNRGGTIYAGNQQLQNATALPTDPETTQFPSNMIKVGSLTTNKSTDVVVSWRPVVPKVIGTESAITVSGRTWRDPNRDSLTDNCLFLYTVSSSVQSMRVEIVTNLEVVPWSNAAFKYPGKVVSGGPESEAQAMNRATSKNNHDGTSWMRSAVDYVENKASDFVKTTISSVGKDLGLTKGGPCRS